MSSAACVWRRSWQRGAGSRPAATTAGRQVRSQKLRRRSGSPSGDVNTSSLRESASRRVDHRLRQRDVTARAGGPGLAERQVPVHVHQRLRDFQAAAEQIDPLPLQTGELAATHPCPDRGDDEVAVRRVDRGDQALDLSGGEVDGLVTGRARQAAEQARVRQQQALGHRVVEDG